MTARPNHPDELLDLARDLAGETAGPGRPRTVWLRRAISTAYYAAFHDICAQVVLHAFDSEAWDERCARVARWLTHTDVRSRAESATGNGKPALRRAFLRHDGETSLLARDFIDLQDARHRADYDDEFDLSKSLAITYVARADDVLARNADLMRRRDPDYLCFLRLGLGAARIARDRSL